MGVFARAEDAVVRRIGDETIIVPVRRHAADVDFIYTLNETGSWVWDCLDGRRPIEEVAQLITAEFDVPREVAEREVRVLIEDLMAEGLVRPLTEGEIPR